MKKLNFLFFLFVLPFFCYGQFFGLGGQYSQASDGQFFMNLSVPVKYQENKYNSYLSSGLEYTTSGGAKLSGLNLKPIQITTYFSDEFFNSTPYTILLGVDGGYLFDFRRRTKNTIVITPNLYIDYKIFFIKGGYDIDALHGQNQFFVRAGIGIGMGTFKMFGKTSIR